MDSESFQPLTFDELGDTIGRASTVLRANAGSAGLAAPVPTCPGWTVLDLVTHVGMVQQWACSHLQARPVNGPAAQAAREQEGRAHPDVLGWFDQGATALLQALVDAPDDLQALVFLENAPSPKIFWARRQAHESTIHAVDALAARLGRPPRADETWISRRVARDGIDELLRGFVPRRRQRLHPDRETRLLVRPDDGGVAWAVELGPDHPARATLLDPAACAEPPDVDESADSFDYVLTGTAVDLYLRLWSRSGADPVHAGEQWWRDHVSFSWA